MSITVAQAKEHIKKNWAAGLTVALISVPLSIALSIASGAGPIPGIITGVWATLIASIFGGSHYNIVGAAGALTTVLFAATLAAPLGLGPAVLSLLALVTGFIIFVIWVFKLDRFLYYVPSSVMYGFAAGVALLIAASQLFDATGLSKLSRTGTLIGDVTKFIAESAAVHLPTVLTFAAFLIFILVWKKYIKKVPAVIPAAVLGMVYGWFDTNFLQTGVISLGEKFGEFTPTLILANPWDQYVNVLFNPEALQWVLQTAGLIALIAVLETLITAKIGDKLTKTESSSSREMLGLALANLGSGATGGLPATGVFIRTGANIKAGATHRTSGVLAAIFTGAITLIVLPLFSFLPMAVIAAILVNTALGLLEIEKFQEFWHREPESFWTAILVALITIFHDAGAGVVLGSLLALLLFARRIARGRFDLYVNYADGTAQEIRGGRNLELPQKAGTTITSVTYGIAGNLGYIDAWRHLANLKVLAQDTSVKAVVIRLRNLFSMDYEGAEALIDGITEIKHAGKEVFISSAAEHIKEDLVRFPLGKTLESEGKFTSKTTEALTKLAI